MNVIYSRYEARKVRLARRAERCRYRVESNTQYRVGVHKFKWIAVTHAWLYDIFLTPARVVDTWSDDEY